MGPVRLGILLYFLTVSGAWAGTPKEEDDDTERLPSKCEGILGAAPISISLPLLLRLGRDTRTVMGGSLDLLEPPSEVLVEFAELE